MSITGKLVGVIVGLLIFRSPWGAIIGLILGHFYDQSVVTVRRAGGGAGRGGRGALAGHRPFAVHLLAGHGLAVGGGGVGGEQERARRGDA